VRRGSFEGAKAAGFPHRGLVFCGRCGGSYIEVGVSGGREIPHSEGCPRNPGNKPLPYLPAEQDRDAAALRSLWAPVGITEEDPDAGDRDDWTPDRRRS
jgi:hypothetical protein